MSNKITVSDATFQDAISGDKAVIVDFWAEWCGPCKMVEPILEEIAGEYSDKLVLAKLNIDDNPSTAKRYVIRGIPTVMVFQGGELKEQVIGVTSLEYLSELMAKYVNHTTKERSE